MTEEEKKIWFSQKDKLNVLDSETQTFGCRHTNPDICGSCYLPNICAFCSKDSICRKPSKKWKEAYKKLKENKNEVC